MPERRRAVDTLARIEAERACERLVARYALAVNDWDLDTFVALFTPDAVWQRPKVPAYHGRAEMRAFMEGQPRERTLRHVNGLCVITLDAGGESASGISQTTVYETAGKGELPAKLSQPVMVVEYRDRMVKVGADWFFARRDTTVVFAAWA
jgi:ketosteroid isomerase-like protein